MHPWGDQVVTTSLVVDQVVTTPLRISEGKRIKKAHSVCSNTSLCSFVMGFAIQPVVPPCVASNCRLSAGRFRGASFEAVDLFLLKVLDHLSRQLFDELMPRAFYVSFFLSEPLIRIAMLSMLFKAKGFS